MGEKRKCQGECGREYDATTEYFYKMKARKDGLDPMCKTCRSAAKREKYYARKGMAVPEKKGAGRGPKVGSVKSPLPPFAKGGVEEAPAAVGAGSVEESPAAGAAVDVERLVSDHWAYVLGVLEVGHPTPPGNGELDRIAFHYKSAFVHGFKHGVEFAQGGAA